MNIQAEKLEIMRLLLNTDNPKVIQAIKQVFQKEKSEDFWHELTPDQKQEIKDASAEIDGGETTNYDSLIAMHK